MFKLDLQDITTIGHSMQRPECVLATASGDLFCSDSRGGYNIVAADGSTQFIKAIGAPPDFMPNGIALMPDRDVLAANLADSAGVWRIKPDGAAELFVAEADGVALPPVNFVGLDAKGRVWISVSTRAVPRHPAFKKGWADGFIAVHDRGVTRIVAEDIAFTNEAIVDPTGEWLYVNETVGPSTARYPIRADASLGPRETVAEYPRATFPDGLTFDADGGVWIVSVASNRIIHVDRAGKQTLVAQDADDIELERIADAFERGEPVRELVDIGASRPLRNIASICFGGADLRTVYMGSLAHEAIQCFRAPVRGAPLVHWHF
jgi:sugar lactone lactonase YvrE